MDASTSQAGPPPAASKKAAPDLPEAELARALGMSREDVAHLRQELWEGRDWYGGDGDAVMYTPAGAEALLALAAGEKKGAPPAKGADGGTATAEALAAALGAERYRTLVCVRVVNPRMLLAAEIGEERAGARGLYESLPGATCNVVVRSSVNFVPGMRLEKCEASATPGAFHYHGRLPRTRGRF